MNRVVKILMERDGINREDAEDLIKETRYLLLDPENPCDVDVIMDEQLGLNPDYLFDVLGF